MLEMMSIEDEEQIVPKECAALSLVPVIVLRVVRPVPSIPLRVAPSFPCKLRR